MDISWELAEYDPTNLSQEMIASALLPQDYQLNESTSIELVVSFDVTQPYQQSQEIKAVDLNTLKSHEVNQTISPEGTKINLFDYWLSDVDTDRFNGDHQPLNGDYENHNNDLSDDQQRKGLGINKGHAFKFVANGGHWSGYNRWTGDPERNDNMPYFGIVNNTLVNGYPELSKLPEDFDRSDLNNNIYDNENDKAGSLDYLFNPKYEHPGKISFENIGNLLQIDDKGYYYYDADLHYARFDEASKKFILYDLPAIYRSNTNDPNLGQFFPFQSEEQVASYYKLDEGEFAPNYKINPSSDLVNHYFGLSMETRFVHKNNGNTFQGENITYEFTGDDDVWVFIDDVLVADLGGIHDKASFSINFATGVITLKQDPSYIEETTLKDQFVKAGRYKESKFNGNTFANNTYHKLKLFYLERGNHESNLKLKYNLLSIPESELVKVNQMGKPVEGVEFSLYKADQSYNYQQEDLLFNGKTDDKGNIYLRDDSGLPMTFAQFYEEYETQHYVLKENNVVDGYRKLDEMKLYYRLIDKKENIGVIESDKENLWQTGAYAQAKVMTIAPNKIQFEDVNHNVVGDLDLTDTDQVDFNPLMFAVVFQKNDKGIWLPMYGDALTGWNVAKDNTMTSIIEAAYQNPYLFAVDTSGAFRVDIDNLPGKVDQYYWFLSQTSQQDNAKYYVAYYYSTANSLNDANKDNTYHIINQTQPTEEYKDFVREFSTKLYVPNIRNSLLVHKMDERMQPLNGATFTLFKESDVTINADGSYTIAENAQIVDQAVTTDLDSMSGGIVFPSANHTLNMGNYYLIETQAPLGYKVNPKPIKVIVDQSGVYAHAGDTNDNVWVARSVGMIVRSMLQFASDDLVDSTLHDIKAQLLTSNSYDLNNSSWSNWNESPLVNDELHLQFEEHDPALDYGLIATETNHHSFPGLICDSGWSKLAIRQCLAHEKDELSNLKEDLGNTDLTNLFSGLSTVIVKDDSMEETGDLIVLKEVVGEDNNVNQQFHFKVELNDSSINGTYYQMEFNNGIAEFSLKHGESIKATGLPTGIEYSVSEVEANTNGYVTSVENATGKISNSEVIVKFINEKVGTGNLTVSKAVTGAGDTSKQWNFEVTLNSPHITGTYGDMTFKDGVATFTLKHNESKTAKDLPNGIGYKVEEIEANNDGYVTTYENAEGIISENTPTVLVANHKEVTGGLIVKKIVTGNDGDTSKEWNFEVTLSNSHITGTYGDMTFKDGVSTFTLKHNESKTAKDLPNGISYKVEEIEANKDGYVTSYENAEGIISENTPTVLVTNDKEVTGGLIIKKLVTGNDGDTSKEWNFTITLSDTSINGTYGELRFIDGKASFTLKHGEEVNVIGLPKGISYTVSEDEANKDGYKTTSSNATGTIRDDVIDVIFTNDKQKETSSLKVTKYVTGSAGDKSKLWDFTVTLDDTSINGTYGDMSFVDGKASFTLVANESKVASGLPVGTRYNVSEVQANHDGYLTKAENAEGTISKEGSVVTYLNHKDLIVPEPSTSNLSIEKVVTGSDGDLVKEWHFTLTLSDTSINGKYGDLTFVNGISEFTLKHGESVTAKGLPIDITYSVSEKEANKDGYITTVTNQTGVIKDSKNHVKFINHKDATGSLKVSKVVSGNDGNHHQSFPMEVKLSDPSINGKYGQMSFVDGIAHFSLLDKQSISATGLPVGISYKVSELNTYGHSVSYTNNEGKIIKDEVSEVIVTNHKDKPVVPDKPEKPDKPSGGSDDIDLTVQKVWKLDNGGKASESVTIELLRNGSHYDQIVLNEANHWIATWWNLDSSAKWSVQEINVPQGFTVSINQEGMTFTITNDDIPGTNGNHSNTNDDQPNMGDNTSLSLWTSMLAISGIAAVALFVYNKFTSRKKS